MQLKMSKPFNQNAVKQLLLQENEFISNIFSKMPLPMSELGKNIKRQHNLKILMIFAIIIKIVILSVSDDKNKLVTHKKKNMSKGIYSLLLLYII